MARKQQKPAGDHTGRKAEELAKQHAAELEKRQGEIALMNQREAEESDEVVDLVGSDRQPVSVTRQPGQSGVTTTTDAEGVMTVDDGVKQYTVKTNDTALVGTGPESPTQVPGETIGAQRTRGIVDKTELNNPSGDRGRFGAVEGDENDGVRGVGVQIEDSPYEVIRVNTTLQDVTIGYGNVFSFEEGRKYRVPRFVAEHLEEKGLVWH